MEELSTPKPNDEKHNEESYDTNQKTFEINPAVLINYQHNTESGQKTSHGDLIPKIVRRLTENGVCIIDNFLSNAKAVEIRDDVIQSYKAGGFQDGMLRNKMRIHYVNKDFRGDVMRWCTEDESTSVNTFILDVVDMMNDVLDTGLFGERRVLSVDAMMTCYQGNGMKFKPHVDCFQRDGGLITAVLYLNSDWQKLNGGELKVTDKTGQVSYVPPIFNRLVIFWSEDIWHEVRPVFSKRFSIVLFMGHKDQWKAEKTTSNPVQAYKKPRISSPIRLKETAW